MSSSFLHPTINAAFDDVEDRITRMGYHFVRILTNTLEYGRSQDKGYFSPLLSSFFPITSTFPLSRFFPTHYNSLSIKKSPFQRAFFVFISFPLICIPHFNCVVFFNVPIFPRLRQKNDKMRHIVVDFDKL